MALLIFVIALGSIGCDNNEVTDEPPMGSPDSYGPVTAEHLTGTTCSYVPEHHEFDFVWSFKSDGFLVEGKKISPDLLEALLGPDAKAEQIKGAWTIDDGKIELVVKTDGDKEAKARTSKLPIYSTGVIRIETPKRQYVFSK